MPTGSWSRRKFVCRHKFNQSLTYVCFAWVETAYLLLLPACSPDPGGGGIVYRHENKKKIVWGRSAVCNVPAFSPHPGPAVIQFAGNGSMSSFRMSRFCSAAAVLELITSGGINNVRCVCKIHSTAFDLLQLVRFECLSSSLWTRCAPITKLLSGKPNLNRDATELSVKKYSPSAGRRGPCCRARHGINHVKPDPLATPSAT